MQVYARGSRTSKHSRDHAGLALGDKLQWMGLKATQWSALGVRHGDLLHLTDEDVTKVSLRFPVRDCAKLMNRRWRC